MPNSKYIAQEVMGDKTMHTSSQVVDAIQDGVQRVLEEEEGCDPLYASRVAYNIAQTIEKDFPLYEEIFSRYLRSK